MEKNKYLLLVLHFYVIQLVAGQCPIPLVLTSTSGTIQSPEFAGLGTFRYFEHCVWIVDVPGDDYCEVTFTITQFGLEYDTQALHFSDLFGTYEVYDGYDSLTLPLTVTTIEATRLVFYTDDDGIYPGFSIDYTVQNCNSARPGLLTDGCWPIQHVTEPSGTISSPNYPSPYPRGPPCLWIIDIPNAECTLSILIKDHDLYDDPDILAIGDKLGSLTMPEDDFSVNYHYFLIQRILIEPVIVTFTSDDAGGDYRGFSFDYTNFTCVYDPCTTPEIAYKAEVVVNQAARTFTYSCQLGWQPSHTTDIPCGTTEILTCDAVCDSIPDIVNGQAVVTTGSTEYLTVCNKGFIIDGPGAEENQIFTHTSCVPGTPIPTCVCDLPYIPEGEAVRRDAVSFDVECDDGFELSSSGPFQCNKKTPTCDPILCPELEDLVAVSRGDVTRYKRNAGYKLDCNDGFVSDVTFNQVHEVDCLLQLPFGMPKCVPENCVRKPSIPNGIISGFSFAVGFTLTCFDGYVSSGNMQRKEEVACDGQDHPKCGSATCMGAPNIQHGHVSHLKPGDSYRLTCNMGYVSSNSLSTIDPVFCVTDSTPKCILARSCEYLYTAGLCGPNGECQTTETGAPYCVCEEDDLSPFCLNMLPAPVVLTRPPTPPTPPTPTPTTDSVPTILSGIALGVTGLFAIGLVFACLMRLRWPTQPVNVSTSGPPRDLSMFGPKRPMRMRSIPYPWN